MVSTKVVRLMMSPRPKHAVQGHAKTRLVAVSSTCSNFIEVFDYSHDGIMRSFDNSQQRIGQPDIDLVFLHDIAGSHIATEMMITGKV